MQNLPLDVNYSGTNVKALFDGVDPRLKLLAVFCHAMVVSSLESNDLLLMLVILPLALCLFVFPLKVLFKRVLAMDGFLIFVLVTLPFSVPAESGSAIIWQGVVADQQFTFSETGLLMAVTIVLKANAILLFLTLLLGRLSVHKLCHALLQLKCPEKLVFVLALSLRYLSVIKQQYQVMRSAMALRGFHLSFRIQALKMLGFLIAMLLVRSLNRSERIFQSMQCRGFVDRLVFLPDFHWRSQDTLIAIVFIGLEVTLLGTQYHAVFV
jgi:cobalt/nickel transport system permease protein